MANNPNDNDPKPLPSTNPSDVPPVPDEEALDEVRIEDLPDLGPVDLAELSGDLPVDDPAHEGEVWSERVSRPEPLPNTELPDIDGGTLDVPVSVNDPSSFSEAGLVDLPDLADAVENDSAQLFKPQSHADSANDPAGVVDNLDPVAPVAPASGWFDASELAKASDLKLSAQRERDFGDSDLFGGPPGKAGDLMNMIESSDIFSGGPIPNADLAATSDVLLGAALDYAGSENLPDFPGDGPPAGSPSELPLGVMPGPGPEPEADLQSGPELEAILEAPDLADEEEERVFDDNDSLFDGLDADSPADHFTSGDDSAPLKNPLAPTKPDLPKASKSDAPLVGGPSGDSDLRGLGITPDFGETPARTPDASSILADLSMMSNERYESASEVRLDSPEFGRTVGGDLNDGSEFGLELPDEMRGPQAPDSASIVWSVQPDVDVFAEPDPDAGTVPEVSLDDVQPPTPLKKPLDKTEKTRPVARQPDANEGDSSVEFSDFPEADDESTASQVFGSLLSAKSNPPGTMPDAGSSSKPPTDEDLIPTDWDLSVSEADMDLPPTEAVPSIRPERGSKVSIGSLSGMPIRQPAKDPSNPDSKTAPVPSLDKNDPNNNKTKLKAGSKAGEPSSPSVEIDWISGSMPQQPVSTSASKVAPVVVANWGPESIVQKGPASRAVPEPVAEEIAEEPASELEDPLHTRRTKPDLAMRPEPRRSGKAGWLGGTLVGAVLAGGACAGAYFGGFLPNAKPSVQVPPGKQTTDPESGNGPESKQPSAADVAAAVRSGDAAMAKKIAANIKDPTPMMKAAQGEAEFYTLVQESKEIGTIAPTNPGVKTAITKLKSFIDDPKLGNSPEEVQAVVRATVQLGTIYHLAGEAGNAQRLLQNAKTKYPKYASYFDAALDRIDETTPAAAPMPDGNSRRLTPADAGQLLLATIVLLQDEPPAKEDDSEAGVFFWRAVRLAKGESYTEAVELIKKAKVAHIKQAKAKAGRGLNPLSDPLEQIFPRSCDDLKAYWELQAAIAENKTVAEAFKKDGAAKALVDLEKKAAGAVKLMTDLKESTEKLTVAAKDLKDAKDLVTKLEKDFKEAEEAKVTAEKKFEAEEKARKGSDEIVMGVVKELQAAKLLPEKYDSAELLAAQKRALDRATGPALGSLLSSEMMAVGGFGLSAGQLIDIAERLSKAERASKVATDKLASEVKRLTSEHTEAMKKLAETHATDVSKLKDDQTTELKKAADKYAADSKKLTDTFEAKIKDLDAAVAAEKKRTDDIAAKFKTDLGNAVTPAQAIDLWLPLLVELRRPSDSDGALAAAVKSLTTSQPDSEDVGKARTVAGLALLFQNKLKEAKTHFESAKSNPNFEAALAAKKQWATATEIGLASVTDPLAAYRRPPELPNRDTATAARLLDAGVRAYKEGRFKDAEAALTESTKSDATDAVAWYFLGATKLALGSTDQGKDDIRQGAAREAASNVTTQVISRALAPIQGPARDAITAARP